MASKITLNSLPSDIHRNVAAFLAPQELRELARVNRYFHEIASESLTKELVTQNSILYRTIRPIYPDLDPESLQTAFNHYDEVAASKSSLIEKVQRFMATRQYNEQTQVMVFFPHYPGHFLQFYSYFIKDKADPQKIDLFPGKQLHIFYTAPLFIGDFNDYPPNNKPGTYPIPPVSMVRLAKRQIDKKSDSNYEHSISSWTRYSHQTECWTLTRNVNRNDPPSEERTRQIQILECTYRLAEEILYHYSAHQYLLAKPIAEKCSNVHFVILVMPPMILLTAFVVYLDLYVKPDTL